MTCQSAGLIKLTQPTALEGYAALKVAGKGKGKGKGLDNMRQALSARFARRRVGEVAQEPAASD